MIYTFEQIQNIPKTAGVYSIVNILNGDRYITAEIKYLYVLEVNIIKCMDLNGE